MLIAHVGGRGAGLGVSSGLGRARVGARGVAGLDCWAGARGVRAGLALAGWAAGRVPACQSRTSCSSRPKMRAKMAMIRACREAGSHPRSSFDVVVARKPASRLAKGEGSNDII